MIDIMDQKADEKIRAALKKAAKAKKLGVIAAVTGISGGEKALREIMSGTKELHIMDRGMLGMHLE